MLLPVLEEKEDTYFDGNIASYKRRHIWGQFQQLCKEKPGLPAVPSTATHSQTP